MGSGVAGRDGRLSEPCSSRHHARPAAMPGIHFRRFSGTEPACREAPPHPEDDGRKRQLQGEAYHSVHSAGDRGTHVAPRLWGRCSRRLRFGAPGWWQARSCISRRSRRCLGQAGCCKQAGCAGVGRHRRRHACQLLGEESWGDAACRHAAASQLGPLLGLQHVLQVLSLLLIPGRQQGRAAGE